MAPGDPGSVVLGCLFPSMSGDMTPLSPKSLLCSSPLQDTARTMVGMLCGQPLGSFWSGGLIPAIVPMAAEVLGGLLCLLRREAGITVVEEALAGSRRLGFCHSPVADMGPGFSQSGDNDGHLTQSE